MDGKSSNSYDLPASKETVSPTEATFTSENTPGASTDKLVERGNWGKPIEFVLACMNYALGLGNVNKLECQ